MRELAGIALPYIAEGFDPSNIRRIAVDFDGVISSASKPFYEAISQAVDRYYNAILGLEGQGGLVSHGDISAMKGTGLFNNDWDLTRILIAYYLALAYRELEGRGAAEGFLLRLGRGSPGDPIGWLKGLGRYMRSEGIDLGGLAEAKREFPIGALASKLGAGGLGGEGAIDGVVGFVMPRGGGELARALRRLVGFDAEGIDLVRELFEEIYLGPSLYRRFYGREPPIGLGGGREGLMALERPLPSKEALRRLSNAFGRLGIYSERPRAQAEYLLENWGLSDAFDLSSSAFVEDIANCASLAGAPRSAMGKPNPRPFLKFLESFSGDLDAIYVGDSPSDLHLVSNARAMGREGISFAGVLSDCEDPGGTARAFRRGGASAIMWDLNQLPEVLGV
jgi:phosphoglycolate phosphatase-like HAD superfamily hydrolase